MTVQVTSGDDQNKSIEDLIKERNEWKSKYENTNDANKKLREDLAEAKAASGDAINLQKQIDRLITEKSKLMNEKNEIQSAFDGYKKEVQMNSAKQHLTTALEEAGARSTSTVMKLIDLSAITFDENGQVDVTSIANIVNSVKTSDPVLFKEPGELRPKSEQTPSSGSTIAGQLPAVKHAADRLTKTGFQTELDAAVASGKQENIEAVMAKYHTVT